ncbi:FixH family protein [Chitinibacter bivalviorum]|uniref:FixH family protein n=1 Tax=Chitinibacter bivalviorum TaxID=2739434 RepID=A0A7H9BGW0_9NEIS|nr:FixH family protein [Chitinibacter bivalviorum]QLG87857.1 FixH family protein [Chitinibacter bivalviorum]
MDAKPWYKHPHVWLLITFPALAIIGGIYMAYLAYTNKDGLVSDNYYKDGQKINERIALDQKTAAQGITAQLLLGDDQQSIRVILNQAVEGELILKIAHPTRDGFDQTIELEPQAPMMFAGKADHVIAVQRWQVELADKKNNWRLAKEWQVLLGEPLLMQPSK